MRKKVFSMLLVLTMCLAVFPTVSFADAVKLSSVEIAIELPNGGDEFDISYVPTVTSFKSGDIDLLANGAGFLSAYWDGDYDRGEDGVTPYFRNGGGYRVTLQLMFGSGYRANGTKASTGEIVAMPETFSATVNGVPATVRRNCSTYYPTIEINLTLAGEVLSATEKAEKNEEWEKLKKTRRAMYEPRTYADSVNYNYDNTPEKVVVMTDPEGDDLYDNRENMTTLIVDVSNADKLTWHISNTNSSLKEVWLSPEVDPCKFIKRIMSDQWNRIVEAYFYEYMADVPLYLAEGTVFIPESRVSEYVQCSEDEGYIGGAFSIKCYSGNDVYAAQKAGASAAKEICANHKYTEQIRSADRVYHFADCNNLDLYYYSCACCGKCEYDPNHVDYNWKMKEQKGLFESLLLNLKCTQHHPTHAGLPTESLYIGVNAAGITTGAGDGIFDPFGQVVFA